MILGLEVKDSLGIGKNIYTDSNFLHTVLGNDTNLSEDIYGLPYVWHENFPVGETISAQFTINYNDLAKIIVFNQRDNGVTWINYIEHTYLLNLLKQFPKAKAFMFGYITGTVHPLGAIEGSLKGITSANMKSGYIFWVKLYF